VFILPLYDAGLTRARWQNDSLRSMPKSRCGAKRYSLSGKFSQQKGRWQAFTTNARHESIHDRLTGFGKGEASTSAA
jgi:hypothetical protein